MTSITRAAAAPGIQNVVVNLAGLVQGITLVTFRPRMVTVGRVLFASIGR